MRLTRLAHFALAASIFAAPLVVSPAIAATAAEVKVGMKVVDPKGGLVGTVTGVQGANLVLKTDKHELHLPLASFTQSEGKLFFGMTAAELNSEAEKQMAAASAAITVGAQVYGQDGTLAGQIEAVDAELVTIKLTGGTTVRLPRSSLAGSDKGAVLGMTAAQLSELASQATTGEPAGAAQ